MSTTGLTEELRKRADEAATEILRAAQDEAERIRSEAERQVGVREREVSGRLERSYRAESRSHLAAARHEAMRLVLRARTRIVSRVLERATELLPEAMQSEAFVSLLSRELAESLGFVGEQDSVFQCPPALESVLRDELSPRSTATVETVDGLGTGFVAIGRGGEVRVDGTLETRLARLAPSLAIEIHQRLRNGQS